MLALTIHQPWAWAIIHLPADIAKPVENRSWCDSRVRSAVGTRIAIHGGKAYDDSARHFMAGANMRAYLALMEDDRACHQGILGTARLAGVCEERNGGLVLIAGDWPEPLGLRVRPWFVGRYGWLLDERRALPEPIPCRGMQGLWTVPDAVAAMVAAAEVKGG